jgi:hypothetical protein
VSFSDDRDKFRRAEQQVRDTLFGDGVFESGRLKGEEARDEVARALRRMPVTSIRRRARSGKLTAE